MDLFDSNRLNNEAFLGEQAHQLVEETEQVLALNGLTRRLYILAKFSLPIEDLIADNNNRLFKKIEVASGMACLAIGTYFCVSYITNAITSGIHMIH